MPLGGERVVGKVEQGVVTWNTGEDPNGNYIIVTKGLVVKFAQAMAKCIRLEQELKIERARKEK